MQGAHFQPHREKGRLLEPTEVAGHCKIADFGAFTSYQKNDHRVTFVGDTHPVFHGSVVKAIASGLRTYPKILQTLGAKVSAIGDVREYRAFHARMEDLLQPKVELVKRHSPTVVEVQVRAPMAAKNFRPGQFFRLQNFERQAQMLEGTRLQTEALALTGAGVDRESGCISLMILEVGASSRLCATLRKGDPIVLMGPTGTPTEIPNGETIMLVGGRRGAAMARTLGPALRNAGNRVLYFAGFQTADEVYCQDDLEQAADVIIWCTAVGEPVAARRPQDRSCTGEFMQIMWRYAAGEFNHNGNPPIPLQDVDRVLVVGSNRLLRMIQDARRGALREYFAQSHKAIASIGSPMQCMLKGVCSQCLQWHIDPDTGKRTQAVFSCAWQDQPLDWIDLDNLDARLNQNRLQEQLTNLWLDYLFAHNHVARV
jgi:NAD(P)H-flavin reductase